VRRLSGGVWLARRAAGDLDVGQLAWWIWERGVLTQESYVEESPEQVPGQAGVGFLRPCEFDWIQRVAEEKSVVGVLVVDGIYQLASPNGISVTVSV